MSRPRRARATALLLVLAAACTTITDHSELPGRRRGAPNPPAPGFDLAGSDPRALEIADDVMVTLGGRDAWDGTRALSWIFFDRRRHVWDRRTGDVRIESLGEDGDVESIVLMNVRTREGRAWRGELELTEPGPLADALEAGYRQWINDSYWLVMPYKLKDTGVTLTYAGERTLADFRTADVLQLTFEGVGVTPHNKYEVYVARDTGLVEQWAFFEEADDDQPAFTTPWAGWRRYGSILLSGDRGKFGRLREILVLEELPRAVFTDPAPVAPSTLAAASL